MVSLSLTGPPATVITAQSLGSQSSCPPGLINSTRIRRKEIHHRRVVIPRATFAQQWDIDGTFSSQQLRTKPSPRLTNGQQRRSVADSCILQGFSWSSHKGKGGKSWYQNLEDQVDEIVTCGFTDVILPPCCQSNDPQGFSPQDFYNVESAYGTSEQLRSLTRKLRDQGVDVGLELVVSRGFGQEAAQWKRHRNTVDEGVVSPAEADTGPSAEVLFEAPQGSTPLMDHSNPFVEADCKGWMLWLKNEFGYSSWCFDLATNLDPSVFCSYCEDTSPSFAIADVWRAMRYNGAALEYDQDQHREDLANWVKASKGSALVLDYTTKGVLQQAVERCEYWRLIDPKGRAPGLVGIMPQHAVTFVDNHFTGSELKWWPFPAWGVMVGYAYILTHPGVPCVFHDHVFDWKLKDGIKELLQARQRNGLNSESELNVILCSNDIYVARIGTNVDDTDKFQGLVLKIGPSMDMRGTCPDKRWQVAASGQNYCVWERRPQ